MSRVFVRVNNAWKEFAAVLSAPTPPSAPQSVTATAYNGGAVLTWSAPASLGTSAVQYYSITASPALPMTMATPSNRTKIAIPFLTNNTAYTFTVKATNLAGTGSGATASTTPASNQPALPLTWSPPSLSSPTTIQWTNNNRVLFLDKNTDYIIQIPQTITIGDMQIIGGRNIKLIGGEISVPQQNRALFIKGDSTQTQARTLHIEGLLISGQNGDASMNDMCDIDSQYEPGLTVRWQNVRVATPTYGQFSGVHADQCQPYNGPYAMQIDRWSGLKCTYQGFFLQPNQFGGWPASALGVWDFCNFELDGYLSPTLGNTSTGVVLYNVGPGVPYVSNAYITSIGEANQFIGAFQPLSATTPGYGVLLSGITGQAPPSDFVPSTNAGVGYTSPGYIS